MNRSKYFNYIEEKLGVLAYRIIQRGKLNILDNHLHCEGFYKDLINRIYGLNMINANVSITQNVEAIDLIDPSNKVFYQVSATNTKQKVESSLEKKIIKNYPGYTFKFISIAKDCKELRQDTFENPHGINFDPKNDIIDNNSLLNAILDSNIDDQKLLYEFIKQELGGEVDIVKLDTNLATVINTLSKENLSTPSVLDVNSFEIERKIDYNKLVTSKSYIDIYAVYYSRLDKKYNEFDKMGSNKSMSVLASINKSYREELIKNKRLNKDALFINVIENVTDKVLNSSNLIQIAVDELELCVNIIVVDAFVRCKIFENPANYNYATT